MPHWISKAIRWQHRPKESQKVNVKPINVIVSNVNIAFFIISITIDERETNRNLVHVPVFASTPFRYLLLKDL